MFERNSDLGLTESEWAAKQAAYEQLIEIVRNRYSDCNDVESEWAMDREMDAIMDAWRRGQDVSVLIDSHTPSHTLHTIEGKLTLVRDPVGSGLSGYVKSLIPGTPEHDYVTEYVIPENRRKGIEDELKKLDRYEELWRSTLRKPEKSYWDLQILRNINVWSESELDTVMAKLRHTAVNNPGVGAWVRALIALVGLALSMISLYFYL